MSFEVLDTQNTKYYSRGFHPEVAKPLPNQESYEIKEQMLLRQSLGQTAVAPVEGQQSQEWRERSLCLSADPELFYPENDKDEALEAKSICALCPVREECLEYAFKADEKIGVWGGYTARDRRLFKRRQQSAKRRAGESA